MQILHHISQRQGLDLDDLHHDLSNGVKRFMIVCERLNGDIARVNLGE